MPLLPNAQFGDWYDYHTFNKWVGQSYGFSEQTGNSLYNSGEVTAVKVPLPRPSSVITSISVANQANGVGLTAGQNLTGVYSVNPITGLCTLVGQSPDQSAAWAAGAPSAYPANIVGGPITLPGGPGAFCYVCVLAVGGTTPTAYRLSPTVGGVTTNTNQTPGTDFLRSGRVSGGATALPASFNISVLTTGNILPWVGLA